MSSHSKDRYGLVGKSLSHSFSKAFFEKMFQSEAINAQYDNFEFLDANTIRSELAKVENLKGFNVTIPYKTAIISQLDGIDEVAQQIGAVNTVKITENKWIGYNTDAFGFHQMIKPFLRNVHERALILGTGGASKAVSYVLNQLGIDVCYLTRKPSTKNQFSYNTANEQMMNAFKLIVNTTPIGMYPQINEMPSIPTKHLGKDHLVIDLIYNPEQTKLLEAAANQGADVLNGFSMLKHQALKAWEIWNS